MFLFSCYTGLRYSDIINLQEKHYIKKGNLVTIKIDKMVKTQKPVELPLNNLFDSKPLKIFRKYYNKDNKYLFGAQKVMPVKGIGEVVDVESLKLSMRVGKSLINKIENGDLPDFFEISKQFDNIPGGIHALSAAVIIPETEYQNVLSKIEEFIKGYKKNYREITWLELTIYV